MKSDLLAIWESVKSNLYVILKFSFVAVLSCHLHPLSPFMHTYAFLTNWGTFGVLWNTFCPSFCLYIYKDKYWKISILSFFVNLLILGCPKCNLPNPVLGLFSIAEKKARNYSLIILVKLKNNLLMTEPKLAFFALCTQDFSPLPLFFCKIYIQRDFY